MYDLKELGQVLEAAAKAFKMASCESLALLDLCDRYKLKRLNQLETNLSLLQIYFPDMIVTGSAALYLYGLVPIDTVHDIDILIPATIDNQNKLQELVISLGEKETTLMRIFDESKKNSQQSHIKETVKTPKKVFDEDEDVIDIRKSKPSKQPIQPYAPARIQFQYLFQLNGWAIDVFSCNDKGKGCMKDSFNLALLTNIVSAKKKYDRLKDYIQLRTISRLFFKEEDFTNYLNDSTRIKYTNNYE